MKTRRTAVYFIYRLLLPLFLPLLLPAAMLKMRRRGGRCSDIFRRLGFFNGEDHEALAKLSAQGRPLWMHAVSVGEVNVAAKLLLELRSEQPALPLVLSVGTTTGFLLAKNEVPVGVVVLYSPVDLRWVVRRFLNKLRPTKIVLIEAEVWPNLLALAAGRDVPVVLANARLSPRSFRRYLKLKVLIEPIFTQLAAVLVQYPEDVENWRSLGVAEDRIHLLGSVKYDDTQAVPSRLPEFRDLLAKIWPTDPPKILLASSFPGEELGLLQALRKLGVKAKVLLVPRHVERTAALVAELAAAGFGVLRRSELTTAGSADADYDAVVVDTTGELRAWQYLPKAVVIGKSFLERGGQNPVEAIAAGTPVITGPHMRNFESLMKQLVACQGLRQVETLEAAAASVAEILENPEPAAAATERAREALRVHQGAARRTAAFLLVIWRRCEGGGKGGIRRRAG